MESESDPIQRKTHDVLLCPLLSVGSAGPAVMPINYFFQCLPTLMPQGLEGYSMHAWGNIISCPSETSEGTARSLEQRELREVLVRIMIIHLLCPVVLVCIPSMISCGTLEFLVNRGTIISKSY